MRLGKKEHKFDERTLALGNFMEKGVLPTQHDFDKSRAKFPLHPWGNDEWGNCVIVGQAHHLARMERLEQRRTLPITTDDVVARYKTLSGAQNPGDGSDIGLVVLDALKAWRGGWSLDYSKSNPPRDYRIAAYGELDPLDAWQLKAAICYLHGIQFGFWLPRTAQEQTIAENPVWDVVPDGGADAQAGSWGGHLVYSKAYFSDGQFEVLTWGLKVKVTLDFVARYCDEAWACVDDFDTWRNRSEIDVEGMKNRLREIGAKVE